MDIAIYPWKWRGSLLAAIVAYYIYLMFTSKSTLQKPNLLTNPGSPSSPTFYHPRLKK